MPPAFLTIAGCTLALTLTLTTQPVGAADSRADARNGTWSGIVEINPASDLVDESGPECRDGTVRLVLTVTDGTVNGQLEPIGNPGAPGFSTGAIALQGELDMANGQLAVRSGPSDHHYNRLSGDLTSGTWRNAACWGEYRLRKKS